MTAFLVPIFAQERALPSITEPGISPDGSEIAFISGGDIWTAPAAGGQGRLLVSHAATESRPLYSPDGRKLAFTSTRTGKGDVYVLDLLSGNLRRITFSDAFERVDGWSRDGQWIYFSSVLDDIAGMLDVFRVRADGGTPMPFSADRYGSEYFAAPGPSAVAVTTKGMMAAQWWRNGHSHIDETEIWLVREGSDKPQYEKVTGGGAKEGWPMWAPDGKALYFVSDRSGAENLWEKQPDKQAAPLTTFKEGRVLWPSISADGRYIVFERNFELWKLDTRTRKAAPVAVALRGVPAGPASEHLTLTSQFSELTLSPDSKKIAFVARGEIFATSAKEGGNAVRVTSSVAPEYDLTWSTDNNTLTYTSSRSGAGDIYSYDVATQTEKQITSGPEPDYNARWSNDGKLLAYTRGGRELRVYNPSTKEDRLLATSSFPTPPANEDRSFVWSPDNRWIAYVTRGGKYFRNVAVVPVSGGQPVTVSFLPNVFGGSLCWSPDGTYLLFDTGQRTEGSRIARIDLVPRTPKFREDQFRDLFIRLKDTPEPAKPAPQTPVSPPPTETTPATTQTPAAPAPATDSTLSQAAKEQPPAPKPLEPITRTSKETKIVTEGIRRRLSLLPLGMDAQSAIISPDGKWLLFEATVAGQQNLYIYSLDELAREPAVARQLTSTPGAKAAAQFSSDSKEIYYLESGRVQMINVDTRVARPLAVTAEVDVNFDEQKQVVFEQAWAYLNDMFYDPKFHGVNWGAARTRFAPYIEGSKTPDEMRRVISLMIGELNASHLGIAAPAAAGDVSGRLGLRFDPKKYEATGDLLITQVLPLSPADVGEIKPGSYLLSVDGVKIDRTRNLDELLEYKINRRVVLVVAASPDGADKREVAVRPCNMTTEKNLNYRAWAEDRRNYVSKISNGRLGYAHIIDMSAESLERFYLDLDSETHLRDGVVVDIRNNNGGFVNAYALDVLARRHYLTMTLRGEEPTPARTMLGQRALEKPTILVVNQHSLSDAEDFAEGYRALKLGKIVGTPTAGWIIYTGATSLLDGSVLRLPRIKITTAEGVNMERNPRPVDITVDRPHGESYTGVDAQLDAAVKELLRQLDSDRSTNQRSQAQR